MIINIKATGIEMTDSIKNYAEDKIAALEKFFDNIIQADIDVGMRNHHHNKGKIYYAEVNLQIPRKIIRVVKDSEDLYKAIDKVRDHLKVEFEKIKGKMRELDREVIREQRAYHDEDGE